MCCSGALMIRENVYASDMSEFATGYHYPTEMRGLTASEITADMGAGWNLGNSLESENNETYWGNPATTKKMIYKIRLQQIIGKNKKSKMNYLLFGLK